jgi:hypothetical protein
MLTDHQLESVVGRHEPRFVDGHDIIAVAEDFDFEPDDFEDLDDVEVEADEFPSRVQ